ncbi:S8 family serine peptidase [Catellatospora bangladeshensis]|uniref:S8 family serine peptidase n=1 Tax=Catellatospora bangladeshensis TaxID=310355 RepID=UPI00360AB303
MHRTRQPAVLAALTVVLTFGGVGISTSPAAAAAPCTSSKAGQPVAEKPWPQQRWDLSALPRGITGATTVVAVLDSGVDADHPQLRGAVDPGLDVLPGGGTDGRQDCVGHGTGVASIIAARPVSGSSSGASRRACASCRSGSASRSAARRAPAASPPASRTWPAPSASRSPSGSTSSTCR